MEVPEEAEVLLAVADICLRSLALDEDPKDEAFDPGVDKDGEVEVVVV